MIDFLKWLRKEPEQKDNSETLQLLKDWEAHQKRNNEGLAENDKLADSALKFSLRKTILDLKEKADIEIKNLRLRLH